MKTIAYNNFVNREYESVICSNKGENRKTLTCNVIFKHDEVVTRFMVSAKAYGTGMNYFKTIEEAIHFYNSI